MISCQEICTLPSLKKLTLVAGKAGLERRVRWVHFIDLPDVVPWVQGGELLIITGIGLNGEVHRLKEIVHGIIKKKLAGIIVNVGPYIKEVPAEVISLADQANFPVFVLPWEVKLVEVTGDICRHIIMKQTEERSINDFLEQLLFRPSSDPEVIIQRAAYYGYDLTRPHQIAIISPARLLEFVQGQKAKAEKDLVALKIRFEQIVRDVLTIRNQKILSMLRVDDVILLMPYEDKATGSCRNIELLTEILARLAAKIPGLAVTAGLGGRFERLPDAKRSYTQANKVLHFSAQQTRSKQIHVYEELGIYKLLFEMESDKLTAYHQEVIEPLQDYDAKHHMELVDSLFVYFEENCNAVKTAKRLFVHRNTLDYRLKKIEEISGRNLSDPYDRLTLQLGVIVGKQLGSEL
ncbi:PucR family transcriptional regulator [Sporomusa sp.]|uniref:PucR family transcriptional regulator n=1 Tax=Sporomusa sp. TaxID=2078658 RepID=UPI002B924F6C|nr:PucR family transcriptional regulator ligand-binding domain-containing protein [Sporomusa sp.]HWR05466.1 PucR family transcriptional regulator ligand-binding domain-containing protein [Sporomusa sp.]